MADIVADNITTDAVQIETTVLTVSDTAVEKIKGLFAERNLTDHGLRVFVAGGGCSGMQYGMAFEGNPQPTDQIVMINGVKLIVDPVSLPYINGARIDFVDSLMGGGFRIENPNAVSSCGCGSSFRTSGEAGADHDHAQGGSCGCH
jgi:iron-sulfur cluster assembly accessory protein